MTTPAITSRVLRCFTFNLNCTTEVGVVDQWSCARSLVPVLVFPAWFRVAFTYFPRDSGNLWRGPAACPLVD